VVCSTLPLQRDDDQRSWARAPRAGYNFRVSARRWHVADGWWPRRWTLAEPPRQRGGEGNRPPSSRIVASPPARRADPQGV